jgi:hypothetical protein
MISLYSLLPIIGSRRAWIVICCAAVGAVAVLVGLLALTLLAQAMHVTWLRDVAVNTGPVVIAGGAGAGGAAAGGGDGGDEPGNGDPTPGTPAPPPPPGPHVNPGGKVVFGPEPEGPPRSAAPGFGDVTWEITFSRWVQAIAGSGNTTTTGGGPSKA